MIQLSKLSKSYGTRVLLDEVDLQLGSGERLGLVGRNGHGKSTLFKIILGEENYDGGHLAFPKNYQIGHLEQHLKFTKDNILDEAALGLKADEALQTYKAEAILFGLGFTKADMQRPPSDFSGGYQIRINLAKVLVSEPDLLLLDEPTNYLDIISIRWLERFLRSWRGEMMIITHDRDFMDAVSTHTAMIHRGKIKKCQGGTKKLYEQILLEEEIYEKTRVNEDKKRKEIEAFVDRFRAKASKASVVQSRVKQLEKMPTKAELADIESLGLKFPYAPFMAKQLLECKEISFNYPGGPELISQLSLTIGANEKVAIIGKNGKGKSTLLNLMAEVLNPTSGEIKRHPSLQAGHFGQTNISRLSPNLTLEDEIASANTDLPKTLVRNICGTMMFSQDDALKKISVLSGGEKSRVLLGKILARPVNLLFLDEPTNHLDMESIAALVESLKSFPGAVVIVTHSEMILRELPTKFVVFQSHGPQVFLGTYDEFLSKVGWEEEDPSQNDSGRTAPKKESAHARAELIKERSKILNPLKKKMEALETEIQKQEIIIKKNNDQILELAQSGNNQAIGPISVESKRCQDKVNQLYHELELLMLEIDQVEEKYQL
jgi:ATP-binding cassette subfamily F protein 3